MVGRGAASTGGEEGLVALFPITNPIDRAKAQEGVAKQASEELPNKRGGNSKDFGWKMNLVRSCLTQSILVSC